MPVSIRTNLPDTVKKKHPPVMVDTPKAFRLILDNSARGQIIIYYTGDLMYDREFDKSRTDHEKGAIARLADVALAAAEINKVHLFQKRLGPYQYEYQAMVRR